MLIYNSNNLSEYIPIPLNCCQMFNLIVFTKDRDFGVFCQEIFMVVKETFTSRTEIYLDS